MASVAKRVVKRFRRLVGKEPTLQEFAQKAHKAELKAQGQKVKRYGDAFARAGMYAEIERELAAQDTTAARKPK